MGRHGMERRHLVAADRHIAKAKELIQRQEALVMELERDNHDTVQARKLLETLKQSLGEFESNRETIVEALARPG